jgi:hypothetical protein
MFTPGRNRSQGHGGTERISRNFVPPARRGHPCGNLAPVRKTGLRSPGSIDAAELLPFYFDVEFKGRGPHQTMHDSQRRRN